MPHVLHLVKDPSDRLALDVIGQQATDPEVRLSVVLLQEAQGLEEPLPGDVYRLDEDRGRGHSASHRPITHAQLLDLIFSADSVVTW